MEPLPPESPLVGEKRIVLSPHSAALTEDALIGMGVKTVENVLAAFDGTLDPELVVNKKVLKELQCDQIMSEPVGPKVILSYRVGCRSATVTALRLWGIAALIASRSIYSTPCQIFRT